MTEQIVFYLFSSIAILAASMVIISRNTVRALLCLVLTFFAASGLWILLEAEFLAVTLVLVYVGAVMVLFMFVVMMLDVELATIREGFTRYLPLGLCVSVLVVVSLVYAINSKNIGQAFVQSSAVHATEFSNVKQLGELLYTHFLYPFELAGILLLVAIVAAISLTFRGHRGRIALPPEKQILANKQSRLRLVKMTSNKSTS
jgi:NADH-quinone oxidoreductase subunit J